MTFSGRMELSINSHIVDKNLGDQRRYFSEGWESHSLTLAELAATVDQGYAFGPKFADGKRLGKNFDSAGFLAIDVDGTLSIAQALENPFIRTFGGLLYHTASHGQGGVDRFRVIFPVESPIESGPVFRAAMLGLAEKLNSDRAIAHAACMLYGCRGGNPMILGNGLPDDEVRNLIKLGREADAARRHGGIISEETPPKELTPGGAARALNEIPESLQIRAANGTTGTVWELPHRTVVFCPFHEDNSPSAFMLRSAEQHPGLFCSACYKAWWAPNGKFANYDFYWFDTVASKLAQSLPRKNADRLARGLPPLNKEAQIINSKYLPNLELREGFVLVKSPKGSGKTTALVKLVADAKRRGLSVLLIGHRQILLRHLADRLGLECYMDDRERSGDVERPDYYAISVDSLPRRLKRLRPYDIVIVDECEQVFSHLIAKTLKLAPAAMTRLKAYIGDARSLYLFDADLNQVTLNFVASARKKDSRQPALLILNTHIAENRQCELYRQMTDLIADMLQAVRSGKRVFVACNSKRRAKLLHRFIEKETNGRTKSLLITADDKISNEVQEFLHDIPKHFLRYGAVVASPAIGTGVDITFPGDAQEVDVVYGIFNSGINTHYDIDQQLGRVRNPKEVKVWLDGRRSYFETELEPIKYDLVQTGDAHPAVRALSFNGADIDLDHPLLMLQATAYAARRASQNRMKDYFVRHKERNGWKIVLVEPKEGPETDRLRDGLKQQEAEIEQEYVKGVVAAEMIDEATWKAYFDRKAGGETISLAAGHEMAKFEIRHFYNVQVTADLVELDDRGRFREVVSRYESLYIHNKDYLQLLHAQWRIYTGKERDFSNTLGTRPLRSLEGILLASGLVDQNGICAGKILSKADLEGFLAFCNERKTTIERDLDVNLRADRNRDPIKTLNLCLDLIGLRMDDLGKTRSGDVTTYRYQLDSECLDRMTRILQRRRDGNRSTLPESLDPPRPPSRRRPVNDNKQRGIDRLIS